MDSFNIGNIKLEKANALKKHRQLQKVANMFRLVEICLVLALISRFTIQLPVSVKNTSEYFKDLTVILVRPRFVFVIGNAIVITLFAKSGQFSGQESSGRSSKAELHEEFVEKSENSHGLEVVHGQTDSVCTKLAVTQDACVVYKKKNFQRSQSVNLNRPPKSNKSSLRRSVTEIPKKSAGHGEGSVKKVYPVDKMNNEEFRCTVEAFIARQKQFRRDEENSFALE